MRPWTTPRTTAPCRATPPPTSHARPSLRRSTDAVDAGRVDSDQDAPSDVAPDVAVDAAPDVAADVPTDVARDVTPYRASAPTNAHPPPEGASLAVMGALLTPWLARGYQAEPAKQSVEIAPLK